MSIRRQSRYLVALLTASLLAFALGVVLGGKYGWLQPFVSVTIVNATGQSVAAMQLTYRSAKSSGVQDLPPLAVGARVVTRFFVSGEGEYTIRATLGDGRRVEAGSGYVEPGYDLTDVLTVPVASTSPP